MANGPKKNKTPTRDGVRMTVRLARDEAMELHRLGGLGGVDEAKRHLRMLRPQLDDDAAHQVAMRCLDPQRYGGIETGTDPEGGDYADVKVTW